MFPVESSKLIPNALNKRSINVVVVGKHSTALCRAKGNIGRSIRKNNVKYYECDKKSEKEET